MKDFIKWLGVNEKIAKIVVWIMIAMIMMILTNTLLESTGLPFYKITADNIERLISMPSFINDVTSWIITLLNFYSVFFLIFRIKENYKEIFHYSIVYLISLILLSIVIGKTSVFCQVYIFLFMIIASYKISGNNKKYILYGLLSIVLNTIIQYIWYMYKIRFINFEKINDIIRIVLSLDHFIIMIFIILIKEIYLKKRGEVDGNTKLVLARNIQQGKDISKQNSKEINKKR